MLIKRSLRVQYPRTAFFPPTFRRCMSALADGRRATRKLLNHVRRPSSDPFTCAADYSARSAEPPTKRQIKPAVAASSTHRSYDRRPLRALFVRLVSGDAGRERGRAVRRGGQSSETVRRTGVAAAVVVLGGTNGWRSGGESRRRPVLAQWPAQIRSGRDGG